MAKTVNQLISELQCVSSQLTSGGIPLKIDGKTIEITAELGGENGDYWGELCIKEGGKDEQDRRNGK